MTELKRLQLENAKLRAAIDDVLKHSHYPIERVWKILAKAWRATKHSSGQGTE